MAHVGLFFLFADFFFFFRTDSLYQRIILVMTMSYLLSTLPL